MITEDQLEQLAIQWFQDTGWNYDHGAVISPEGVAAVRLNQAIPEEASSTHKDSLSGKIKSKGC